MKTKILLIISIFSCALLKAQTYGCTDPQSINYNLQATHNDGSCLYEELTLSPTSSTVLPTSVIESSGMIIWNNKLITHNDSADSKLYELDSLSGALIQTYTLPTLNTDWEEISQDEEYIYVGDFGNNAHGNRANLHIIRITKESLLAGSPVVDTINFTYQDQISLASVPNNTTNFDCEAFIVKDGFIYLFTKQWSAQSTSVYKLSIEPGNHVAELLLNYPINGMVTGATYNIEKNILALTGYNNTLSPFIMLLSDFEGDSFFSGNKRRVNIPLQLHQIEAITSSDGLHYYLTNERLVQLPYFNIPAKLHKFDLSNYVVDASALGVIEVEITPGIQVVDNTSSQVLEFKCMENYIGNSYQIIDSAGKVFHKGIISKTLTEIYSQEMAAGVYSLVTGSRRKAVIRFLKQ